MLDLRYRTILSVAIPLMGSSFVQSVVMITDSSFLSRYSTTAFDAAGNGGLLYVTLFITMIGLNDGAQILMARRIGQQREDALSRIFGTTLLTNLLFATLLFLLFEFVVPGAIHSYTYHQDVADAQTDFLRIRGGAVFFGILTLAINAYFTAMGKTLMVFLNALVIACSNILLDYLLIFGHGGFSAMGIEGAALASTIADGLGMCFSLLALALHPCRKGHQLFGALRINRHAMKELLKLSSPIMLQGLIALSTWTIFFAWIEQLGKHELTVSQNIRSLYFLAFIPIWGFAGTTKTYISQFLGMKDFDGIRIIMRRIQLLTLAFLIIFFHGAILYPEKLILIINPEAAYLKDSADILRFVTGSVFIYGIGSVYFQTINGSGNTRYTFLVELIAVVVYLITAYLLIKVYALDIFWIWSVEYLYFVCMAGLSIAYLKLFNWQKKQI